MAWDEDVQLAMDYSISVVVQTFTLKPAGAIYHADLSKPNGTKWRVNLTEESMTYVAKECRAKDKKHCPKLPKRKGNKLKAENINARCQQLEVWLRGALYLLSNLDKGSFLRALLQLDADGRYTPPAKTTDINRRAIAVVTAIADYTGRDDFDLDFKEGDIISVLDDSDPNWWKGKMGMRIGVFPSNYVELLATTGTARAVTEEEMHGRVNRCTMSAKEALLTVATAVYDYDAQNPDELSFKAGDVIGVVDQSDSSWWRGTHMDGSAGLFPAAYVESTMGAFSSTVEIAPVSLAAPEPAAAPPPKKKAPKAKKKGKEAPEVGSRVLVTSLNESGCVRYKGPVPPKAGEWLGVQLDSPCGRNDGTAGGVWYFEADRQCGVFCRADQVEVQDPPLPVSNDPFVVGDRVLVNALGVHGTVRYFGETKGRTKRPGQWVGIELDTAEGRNNGTVDGFQYFSCPSNRGVFCKPDACVVVGGEVKPVPRPSNPPPPPPGQTCNAPPGGEGPRGAPPGNYGESSSNTGPRGGIPGNGPPGSGRGNGPPGRGRSNGPPGSGRGNGPPGGYGGGRGNGPPGGYGGGRGNGPPGGYGGGRSTGPPGNGPPGGFVSRGNDPPGRGNGPPPPPAAKAPPPVPGKGTPPPPPPAKDVPPAEGAMVKVKCYYNDGYTDDVRVVLVSPHTTFNDLHTMVAQKYECDWVTLSYEDGYGDYIGIADDEDVQYLLDEAANTGGKLALYVGS